MSQDERSRDRGNLFEYAEKQKPSQPSFHGDCTIDGVSYELRGWHREEQMAITLTRVRSDKKNSSPPDVFRGVLDPAPPKPTRGKNAPKESAPAAPSWSGDIVIDEAAYTIRAFEKQGKSGLYFTLSFEKIDKPAPTGTDWATPDPD